MQRWARPKNGLCPPLPIYASVISQTVPCQEAHNYVILRVLRAFSARRIPILRAGCQPCSTYLIFSRSVRILVIPILALVFSICLSPWAHPAAAVLFALACLTDWLDGYVARSLKQSTRLGAFLDPVADKLMVSVVLILVVGEPQFQFISLSAAVYAIPVAVITVPAAIIVSREIIVSALREWMAEIGKRTRVTVSYLGKIKTTIQMIALTVLLYCDATTHVFIVIAGYALLYVAAVLTIWSMMIYLKAAWPAIKSLKYFFLFSFYFSLTQEGR